MFIKGLVINRFLTNEGLSFPFYPTFENQFTLIFIEKWRTFRILLIWLVD